MIDGIQLIKLNRSVQGIEFEIRMRWAQLRRQYDSLSKKDSRWSSLRRIFSTAVKRIREIKRLEQIKSDLELIIRTHDSVKH